MFFPLQNKFSLNLILRMDTFNHIKSVISIVLGLSIGRLLTSTVKFIQHPGRSKPYWIHLLWGFYIFLLLIHFWWWEFRLTTIETWNFTEYFFLILYVMIYYVLCSLLYPDDVKDYQDSFKAYFYSRKNWFFSILAVSYALDLVDTAIKGKAYLYHFGPEYPIRNVIHILLCLLCIRYKSEKFHGMIAILFILYEISYILRLYYFN